MNHGVLVIDKPSGFTSFDVVAVLRRLTGQKKIGHTGTLDPMATGVLPMLVGTAAKAQSLIPDTDKEYLARFRLGVTTDTQDSTGRVLNTCERPVPRERLEQVLAGFRGTILQTPPMFSAIKQDGVRLYQLARQGVEVERRPRPVTIYRLTLEDYCEETRSGALRVRCSKGTYIRTLCHDVGEALGCGGVMTALRRTMACGFSLADSVTLEQAGELAAQGTLLDRLLPTERLFCDLPAVRVTAPQATRFCNGGGLAFERLHDPNVPAVWREGTLYRVTGPQGEFLGLGTASSEKRELCVAKLFARE